jgi:hypothetical protein
MVFLLLDLDGLRWFGLLLGLAAGFGSNCIADSAVEKPGLLHLS